jgi:hypothetical protein
MASPCLADEGAEYDIEIRKSASKQKPNGPTQRSKVLAYLFILAAWTTWLAI